MTEYGLSTIFNDSRRGFLTDIVFRFCVLASLIGFFAMANAEAYYQSHGNHFIFDKDIFGFSGLTTNQPSPSVSSETEKLLQLNFTGAGTIPYRLADFEKIELAQADAGDSSTHAVEQQVTALYEQFVSYAQLILDNPSPARLQIPGYEKSLEFIEYSLDKATEAYNAKDFSSVNRIILAALDEVEKANAKEHEAFNLYMQVAEDAYLDERIEQAQESIAWAQDLRPNDGEAQTLKQQIDKLPKLFASRREAQDARAAGNLSDELRALKQVLTALPQDDSHASEISETQKRIQTIEQIQRDQIFVNTIAQGEKAIVNQNINAAENALKTAQKLRPTAVETKRLQLNISAVKINLRTKELLQTAMDKADSDDWDEALTSLEQILKLDPNHTDANEQRDLAIKIVTHQKQIESFISRPHRLASANIATAAREVINSARELTFFSKRLGLAVADLKEKIQLWETAVSVRVISDGNTEIIVRGVGVVGQTDERTIELKAGHYIFEGSRKGYKSVLVEALISHGTEDMPTVTVICDEKV